MSVKCVAQTTFALTLTDRKLFMPSSHDSCDSIVIPDENAERLKKKMNPSATINFSDIPVYPTIGRIVHYFPSSFWEVKVTYAAIVTGIDKITDRINIAYFDSEGNQNRATQVPFVQDNEPIPSVAYCMWPKKV